MTGQHFKESSDKPVAPSSGTPSPVAPPPAAPSPGTPSSGMPAHPFAPQVTVSYVDHEGNPVDPQTLENPESKFLFSASATTSSGEITSGEHHMHPLVLLNGAAKNGISSLVLLALGFGPLLLGRSMDSQNVFFGGLGVIMLVLGFAGGYVHYRYFTWELTDDALIIRENMINKKMRQIPLERIHSIDLNAKATQRVLGLVDMTIDTGASSGASFEKNQIESMKLADAEALKREIFARKQAYLDRKFGKQAAAPGTQDAPVSASAHEGRLAHATHEAADVITGMRGIFAGADADREQAVQYARKLTTKELVFYSFSKSSAFGVIVGFIALVIGVLNFGNGLIEKALNVDERLEGVIDGIATNQDGVRDAVLSYALSHMPSLIGLVIVVILVAKLFSVITNYIELAGFSITRRGNRFEVSRGLLSRHSSSAAINRVQSVVIHQTPLYRILGYAAVSVNLVKNPFGKEDDSVGNDEHGLMLHPCIKLDDVPALFEQAIPEYAQFPTESQLKRLPPVALRRKFVRTVRDTLIGVGVALIVQALVSWAIIPPVIGFYLMPVVWFLVVFATLMSLVHDALSYRIEAIGHDDKSIVAVTGALAKELTIIHRSKIQMSKVSSTWFQRRLGLATVALMTGSDFGIDDLSMRDIRQEDADEFVVWASVGTVDKRTALIELAKQGLLTAGEHGRYQDVVGEPLVQPEPQPDQQLTARPDSKNVQPEEFDAQTNI